MHAYALNSLRRGFIFQKNNDLKHLSKHRTEYIPPSCNPPGRFPDLNIIRDMIKRFEETGKLGVQPGRGRKRVTPILVDAVKTDVDAQSHT